MGRSYTPRYVVETTENFGKKQTMCWSGPVSDKKLAAWVAAYEASFELGGNNAHISASLGYVIHVSRAVIRKNVNFSGPADVVATYNAPMFAVK